MLAVWGRPLLPSWQCGDSVGAVDGFSSAVSGPSGCSMTGFPLRVGDSLAPESPLLQQAGDGVYLVLSVTPTYSQF